MNPMNPAPIDPFSLKHENPSDRPDSMIPMSGEHQGLPVRGYRPQTASKVELVNAGKAIEAELIRYIHQLMDRPDVDQRMASLAKTNIQQGCMWAYRSVFQPSED